MLRNISCLYLSVACYLLCSANTFSQNIGNQLGNAKFTFTLDHKSIQKETVIDQTLTLPTYKITLNTIPVFKTCVSLKCHKSKFKDRDISKNQTWGGIFLANQKFNTSLPTSEVAYRLSDNIKGLDPILANTIINKGILTKIKFKKRPKNWNEFSEFIEKIQQELKILGIKYDLFNQVINVFGYENGMKLDYYKQEYCVKHVSDCEAEQLDIRKDLISTEQRSITINYIKPTTAEVFLFDHEKDSFEFLINTTSIQPEIINKAEHNNFLINIDPQSTLANIVVNIIALSRKQVPLNDKFINFMASNYVHGMFFEWRLGSKQLNSMLLTEKQNITISYELCEMRFVFCAKKIKVRSFNLSTVGLPNQISSNEALVHRLVLGKDELKPKKTYQMTYTISVEGSSKIAAPEVDKKRMRIQYIPY